MHSYLHGHPSLLDAVKRLEQLNPDQFELYFQKKSVTRVESKNLEVESLSQSEDMGLSIRVIHDRRLGFSFTTSLSRESIEKAVDSAFEIASVFPQDECFELFRFGSTAYPEIDALDNQGLNQNLERKIEAARKIEAECRKFDKRITGVRSSAFSEALNEIHLVDSHGESIRYQYTLYTGEITCKAEEENSTQIGQEFGFSNFFESLDLNYIGKTAAGRALELLHAQSAPTLHCPVVLRNSVVAEFLDFLADGISAEQIDKRKSVFTKREGERIFSEKVTLVNHGLLPGGYSTRPFDGEGIPCSRTVIAEGGFFLNALYDGYYARKLKKKPTGSSVRGVKNLPSIRPSNFYMESGKTPFEHLLDGISKGVLITELMGLHTANPVTGSFSLGASGILIENGKLTKPIKGFAVAGNVLEVFGKISDIGDDLRFFGNIGAPSIRIRDLAIGGV